MSAQQPPDGLPLPHLIDTLARLEQAVGQRVREHHDELARRALDEGKAADFDAGGQRSWPAKREWRQRARRAARLRAGASADTRFLAR